MAGRFQCLFLTALTLVCSVATLTASAAAAAEPADRPIYEPQVERRQIDESRIDSSDFEIGIQAGVLSIEDFGSNDALSLRLHYHVNEDLFLIADVLQSKAGKTSYENLSGGIELLTDDQRDYQSWSLGIGWNLLPGEAFLGRGRALNTAFYLRAGIGSTRFADDDHYTLSLGGGYRALLSDWFAVHIEALDQVFDSDLLGEDKRTNNLSFSTGITVFF